MDPQTSRPEAPSVPRRLGALLYDLVLLLGLLMLATLVLIVPYDLLAAQPYPHARPLYRTALQLYLLATIVAFYLYFWTHGGQTLGMRTWRWRLVREDGAPLTLADALRRLAWSAAGLAPALLWLWLAGGQVPDWAGAALGLALAALPLAWALQDPEGLAWHDRRSRTRPVMVGA
jgi:uncharacterized RDD family membrane protein YckC